MRGSIPSASSGAEGSPCGSFANSMEVEVMHTCFVSAVGAWELPHLFLLLQCHGKPREVATMLLCPGSSQDRGQKGRGWSGAC